MDDLEMQIKSLPSGRKDYVAIRPEDIVIKNKMTFGNDFNVFKGKVLDITNRGP